ncbi:MAG TPA: hypothetical protein VFK04_14450 [Gemmatimonadaceae bacterium]|nr:hypothetical protein [Gemmatimonadaceae bacterium]
MVRISRSTRKVLADCSYFLGSVWGAAGALKLIFGVRITFPLFPPIGLERVSPGPAIAVALGLFALGAWLGRGTEAAADRREIQSLEPSHEAQLGAGGVVATPASSAARAAAPATRSPSARRE